MFDVLLELVGGSAWAYPAIACIVTIDGFFPLVPGETSVVAGAILAANDELSVTLVFVAAAIGAVIGDNVASRFVPGGRTAVTFSAGALAYPWRRFIAADLIAAAVWAGFSTAIGWHGGNAYEESLWKPLFVAIGAGIVVALLGELFVRLTRNGN
jgi:membrane-associated protein